MNSELLQSYVQSILASAPDRLSIYRKSLVRWAYYAINKRVNIFLKNEPNRINNWVIMPGLRGTGKTTIVSQLYFNLIQKNIPQSNLVYVSLDDLTAAGFSLYEFIKAYEKYRGIAFENLKEKIFFLIDEAHYDPEWSKAIKTSIIDRTDKVFVLVTGSSALDLQSTPDTARRVHIERLFPMTFPEYIMLKHHKFPTRQKLGHTNLKDELNSAMYDSRNAKEVKNKLDLLKKSINDYWSSIKTDEIEKYLLVGALPFTLEIEKDEEVFERIKSVMDKVIKIDLSTSPRYVFGRDTLSKTDTLLFLLSVSEKVSYDALLKTLNVSDKTLTNMLRALEDSEILIRILAYGGPHKVISKTPRYIFSTSNLRAAFLYRIGKLNKETHTLGRLFEDVVGCYLTRFATFKRKISVYYASSQKTSKNADFILYTHQDQSHIVLEVSYGGKDTSQVKSTIKRIGADKVKYGLVVSKEPDVRIENNIVFVPIRYFLLS